MEGALEPPDCPVCLQPFDGDSTIPRVLACGHSACESCLTQLPKPYPHSLRCPACTQLVNYPHPQGPSALPKNIDLLRLSSFLQTHKPNLNNSHKPNKEKPSPVKDRQFVPNSWSSQFYSTWKDWIMPKEAVLVDPRTEDGSCSVLHGRIASSSACAELPTRCSLKENQKVSLYRVAYSSSENDSKFNYSYIAQIMQSLYGMKETERADLCLILKASCSRLYRACKVYGLWYNLDDRCIYLACERYGMSSSDNLGYWRNGFENEDSGSLDMFNFAMIGMEICEILSGLHMEGLITGCLALSCFELDDFRRVCVDLNEVLAIGMEVRRTIAESVLSRQKVDSTALEISFSNNLLKTNAFVSPELLFELLQKEGIDLDSSTSRYSVGYGSDVWSLACILLQLLIGKPFAKEMCNYLPCLTPKVTDEKCTDNMDLYMSWMEKVGSSLQSKLGFEFGTLQEILCKCLNFDPGSRPVVTDVWKCIRELIIKPKFNTAVSLEPVVMKESTGHCLVLGEMFQLPKETSKIPEKGITDGLQSEYDNNRADIDQVGEAMVDRVLMEGLPGGHVKCEDLKGHLDSVTGLAVGGGFLFSSSFDKTVRVWSLQDFSYVHSFKGHDHKVTAVVFVNGEEPLCVSGDREGGICIWGISIPFSQEPIKKWSEQKDWRYSGIHALASSGTQYLYTGSGDKSIKVWSLKDYTLSCTMSGHKSVVSTLAVCDGVLYSGSWDGTIRLWSLNDHSPLAVLGEDAHGNVTTSVMSLTVDRHVLVVAYESGSIKIWRDDVLMKSTEAHQGAILSVGMEGKWLFTGGWDKSVKVQEISGDDFEIYTIPVGSIACDSVVTALFYWQGKLFVGHANRLIKVHYYAL